MAPPAFITSTPLISRGATNNVLISSRTNTTGGSTIERERATTNPRWTVRASLNDNNNNKIRKFFRRKDDNNNNNNNNSNNFEKFDGSQPLLPAWQPSSLEQDFSYASSRIVSREQPQPQAYDEDLISIQQDSKTMFASVIQHDKKIWLRPLLLNDEADGEGFIDLRGSNDVILDSHLVEQAVKKVDGASKIQLMLNLTATESDICERTIHDEDGVFSQMASNAIVQFLSSLHRSNRERQQQQQQQQ